MFVQETAKSASTWRASRCIAAFGEWNLGRRLVGFIGNRGFVMCLPCARHSISIARGSAERHVDERLVKSHRDINKSN
jgi:hypothetical protein